MQSVNDKSHTTLVKVWTVLKNFFPVTFLAALFAYCVFLFSMSSMSSFPVSFPFPSFDKIVHFCLYGGLSAIVAMGLLQAERRYSSKMFVIIPVGFCVIYSLSDEVHQFFVESRMFETGDIAADIIGASAAALFLLFVKRKRNTNRRFHGEGDPK